MAQFEAGLVGYHTLLANMLPPWSDQMMSLSQPACQISPLSHSLSLVTQTTTCLTLSIQTTICPFTLTVHLPWSLSFSWYL